MSSKTSRTSRTVTRSVTRKRPADDISSNGEKKEKKEEVKENLNVNGDDEGKDDDYHNPKRVKKQKKKNKQKRNNTPKTKRKSLKSPASNLLTCAHCRKTFDCNEEHDVTACYNREMGIDDDHDESNVEPSVSTLDTHSRKQFIDEIASAVVDKLKSAGLFQYMKRSSSSSSTSSTSSSSPFSSDTKVLTSDTKETKMKVGHDQKPSESGNDNVDAANEESHKTVIVSNLEPDINEYDLKEIFSHMHDAHDKAIKAFIHENSSGNRSGIGFVTFRDRDVAKRVVAEYDGAEIDGRPMYLSLEIQTIKQ